jgi:acyl-CoA reductase-like NAD-dependent aldehyde dehydrogenase
MDHGYAMDMPWAKDANQEGYFVGPTIFAEVKRGMQIYVSRLRWRAA